MNTPEQESFRGWDSSDDMAFQREFVKHERVRRRKAFNRLRESFDYMDELGLSNRNSALHTYNRGSEATMHVMYGKVPRLNGGFVTRVIANVYAPKDTQMDIFATCDFTVHDRKNIIAVSRDERKIPKGVREIDERTDLRSPLLTTDNSGFTGIYTPPNYEAFPPDENLFAHDGFTEVRQRRILAETLTKILFQLDSSTIDQHSLLR